MTSAVSVQVTAPDRWRPDTLRFVQVKIQAVPPRLLPVNLMPGVTPATAAYRIWAEPAVQTADASRFLVRLPVQGSGAPVPLRLTAPMLDRAPGAKGTAPSQAYWTSDAQATRRGNTIKFQTTTLSSGEAQSITWSAWWIDRVMGPHRAQRVT